MRGPRAAKARNAGILLGMGLGGVLAGIVHPIPDWLDLLAWVVAVAGVFVLWSALRGPGPLPSTRGFAGALLIGWGAFNLVEGALYHHVLASHHMRPLAPTYDWGYLLVGGLAFLFVGVALRDTSRPTPFERRSGYDRRAPG